MVFLRQKPTKTVCLSEYFLYVANKTLYRVFCSFFESHCIWAAGLIVDEHCDKPSHWRNARTLSQWMKEQDIPGIQVSLRVQFCKTTKLL